MITPFLDN